MKGVVSLPSTGYIQVHAYASNARLPLQDVAVRITDMNDNPIALRLTDRSGTIVPVEISVPDISAGQTPDTGIIPFTRVNIYARLENYERIEAKDVQVFPSVVTLQNLEMIPLSELPESWNASEVFDTPAQNL